MKTKKQQGGKYSQILNQPVAQTQQLHGGQVQNAAGGWGVQVDCWTQLNRFLLLGTTGGNYYFGERSLTRTNIDQVLECIRLDGQRVVQEILDIDVHGRAPKKSPALFCLALVTLHGSTDSRRAAYSAVHQICRTPSHLYEFLSEVDGLGKGWGRGLKRAIGQWFTNKDDQQLSYQLVKYRQRNGYTARDALRLSHPRSASPVLTWAVKGGEAPNKFIQAYQDIAGKDLSDKQIVSLIEKHHLPWEALPSDKLNKPAIWTSLVMQGMPMTALVRNLGKISGLGLMNDQQVVNKICGQLTDQQALTKARVHPLTLLVAGKVYSSGRGVRGSLVWNPNQQVIHSLNQAMTLAYGALPKSKVPTMVAVDVSGSMHCTLPDFGNVLLHEVSACMMLAHAQMNPASQFVTFDTNWREFPVLGRRYDDILESLRATGGGTDVTQAVEAAQRLGSAIKCLTIYSDSETWAGHRHCDQAWGSYLQVQPEARVVMASMTANRISAFTQHPSVLQTCGFDTSLPQIVQAWAADDIQFSTAEGE